MTNPLIEVLILAAVALFVLSRLYIALGRDEHRPEKAQQPERDRPRPTPVGGPVRAVDRPTFAGPGAAALEAIYEADRSFDPDEFLKGARAAYDMIVGAYAAGDRDALKPLLDDDVYEAWDEAITNREATGEAPFELLRLRRCEIDDAELEGETARVMVRYEAELGDGETTRTAREIWIYKRSVTSKDPNWLLDDVEAAN